MRTKKQNVKHHYIDKMIMIITGAGYLSIIALLAIMDTYLVINSLHRYINSQQMILGETASEISYSLQDLDKYIYEHWYADAHFSALSTYSGQSNLLENRYELMEDLKLKLSVNKNVAGFFVFYSGKENCIYVVDPGQINPDETVQLKTQLSVYHNAADLTRSQMWMLEIMDRHYEVIGYARGNAAIYGIYNLDIPLDKLQTSLAPDSNVFIFSEDITYKQKAESELAAGLFKESEKKGILQNLRQQVLVQDVDDSSIKIVAVVQQRLRRIASVEVIFILILFVGSIILAVWVNRFLHRHFLFPLRELNETMERIRRGEEYQNGQQTYVLYEFDEINRTFGYMIKALEEQKIATYEETMEKQKARIQYLQLQLKPHFYLNGLKTVNALAFAGDTFRLQEYIQRLSVHMRYLLSLEKEYVTLAEELKFTENYIDLQRDMTGRQIEYCLHHNKEDLIFPVPVLCIQTFVENSVKYAKLGDAEAILKITVDIRHLMTGEDSYLDITVRDNGSGYPENVLEKLNKAQMTDTENVGVNNIRRRCLILYGNRVSFLFENNGGASSEIIIPEKRGMQNECADRG